MAPPLTNPLNEDHCELCRKILASVPPALDLCDRIEACGVDMSEERQRLRDQQARADAILRQFFPDQS